MNLSDEINNIIKKGLFLSNEEQVDEILKLFEKKIDKKIQENFFNHYMYLRALKELQQDIINN